MLKLTLQGDHLGRWVHDSGVGRDWTPGRISRVGHVNDDNLSRLANFLPHTNVLVRLHGESGKANVGGVDANILELYVQHTAQE